MSDIYCEHGTVAGACGVGSVSGFDYNKPMWMNEESLTKGTEGGAGWLTAGFIEKAICKDAYHTLCKKYGAPIYQSPVRKNVNSDNEFFFAVWDCLGKTKKIGFDEMDD